MRLLLKRSLSNTVAKFLDPNSSIALKVNVCSIKCKSLLTFLKIIKESKNKEKLVILGYGWGSATLLKHIDKTKYNIFVVSPRPWFVLTPLLASLISNFLTKESLFTPINKAISLKKNRVKFIHGKAVELKNSNQLVIQDAAEKLSTINFDKLVIAVGARINTFNIPGVKENVLYLKEIEDAEKIKHRIQASFAKAQSNELSDDEKRKLLSFVVIGGGPTGVEAAAEIHDLIKEDLSKTYPAEARLASVSIVEMLPKLLPTYDNDVSEFTAKKFNKQNINQYMQHRVTSVSNSSVTMTDNKNIEKVIDASSIIWTTGLANTEFADTLLKKLDSQKNNRVLKVDQHLKLIGFDNIYALGDCVTMNVKKLESIASSLYDDAEKSKYGPTKNYLRIKSAELCNNRGYVQMHKNYLEKILSETKSGNLSKSEFINVLKALDDSYHAPAPTAQMAVNAGNYLAISLNRNKNKYFKYPNICFAPVVKGCASYVGDNNAIIESKLSKSNSYLLSKIPLLNNMVSTKYEKFKIHGGSMSKLLWASYYYQYQFTNAKLIQSIYDNLKKYIVGGDAFEPNYISA